MDVNNLARLQRNLPKAYVFKPLGVSEQEKEASLYGDLSVALAILAEKTDSDSKLATYCRALLAFLGVANEKKWTYLLLLSPEGLKQFKQKWQTKSFSKIYLILQQQLMKSYFERRSDYFVHAWRIFIKFGLVELNLTETEIEEYCERLATK